MGYFDGMNVKKQSCDFSQIQRVLVAKLRHHGDVLLSAPLFSLLKKRFPHLEIDCYLYSETLPMLEGHPAISNFLMVDKGWKKLPLWKRYFKEVALLRKIRKGRYDLVINLTEGDRGAIAAKVSGARYAVGFDPEGGGMRGKVRCYTHLVKSAVHPRHAVEQQLDALRVLGIYPEPDERGLTFYIPPESQKRVEVLLPERYILFHPVSRWMFKTVPAERIAEVATALERRGEKVVLTASSDPIEREMNRTISLASGALDLSGKLSLKELGAVIRRARLLVTVDSVSLHLASVFKTPVVAIFGPTCEKKWGPWQHDSAQIVALPMSCRPCYRPGCAGSGVSDCLFTLPTERILGAVDFLLS